MRSLCIEDDIISPMQDNFRPPCCQGDRKVKRCSMKVVSLKNIVEKPIIVEAGSKSILSTLFENLPLIGGCLLAISIPVIIALKRK